jgi:hypothetical protein
MRIFIAYYAEANGDGRREDAKTQGGGLRRREPFVIGVKFRYSVGAEAKPRRANRLPEV